MKKQGKAVKQGKKTHLLEKQKVTETKDQGKRKNTYGLANGSDVYAHGFKMLSEDADKVEENSFLGVKPKILNPIDYVEPKHKLKGK